jgi:SAM-dependent methyltransferase
MSSVTENKTSLEDRLTEIEGRLKGDSEALRIFTELQTFPLGLHLLQHGSLDGKWTKYCVADQALSRRTKETDNLCDTEDFILNQAPTMLATQERFLIFQRETQKLLRDGQILASVPCGYMDDLLSLNYEEAPNTRRLGMDIDQKSIIGTIRNADHYHLGCDTQIADAWHLPYKGHFDIITSNGLNIYVEDHEDECRLYQSLSDALKENGTLVTSFLTPPPWEHVNAEDAAKQKLIFGTILGVKWQVFRTEDEMRKNFANAGLSVRDVIYDSQRLFPTIIARRLS